MQKKVVLFTFWPSPFCLTCQICMHDEISIYYCPSTDFRENWCESDSVISNQINEYVKVFCKKLSREANKNFISGLTLAFSLFLIFGCVHIPLVVIKNPIDDGQKGQNPIHIKFIIRLALLESLRAWEKLFKLFFLVVPLCV